MMKKVEMTMTMGMQDEDEEKFPRKPDGTLDLKEVEAPTLIDGTPVDKEEAADMHAKLAAGVEIRLAPGAEEDLIRAGLTIEDIRKMLMAGAKKTMS